MITRAAPDLHRTPLPLPVALLRASGVLIRNGGELALLEAEEGLRRLAREPHLVCHAAYLADRLALAARAPGELRRAAREMRHFDVAELFLFVLPAQFAVPTARGIARGLGVGQDDDSLALAASVEALFAHLAAIDAAQAREALQLAQFLRRANWPWAPAVIECLRNPECKLEHVTFVLYDESAYGTHVRVAETLLQ